MARQLRVTPSEVFAASGHDAVILRWTNTGNRPCLMTGWAGADGLDASGHSVAHAGRSPRGYMGGIDPDQPQPEVVLQPGQTASDLIETSTYPQPGHQCVEYAGLLVTAPEDTTSVRLDVKLRACDGLSIHPLVAGDKGGYAA